MRNGIFKYVIPGWFITFVTVLYSISGNLMIQASSIPWLPDFFKLPSASVIVVTLIVLIDKYAWHWPIISKLYWSKDIRGRYKGTVEYIHPITKVHETKPCFVEIQQTGSALHFVSYFQKVDGTEPTKSVSILTSFIIDEHDNLSLIYNYRNEGGTIAKFPPHQGTNILEIKKAASGAIALEGPYFTDREPQTKGVLRVIFESKTLKKEF